MGLHGGGEDTLSSGATGWGTLPPINSSSDWTNNSANNWPNNNTSSRQISNCDQTISTSPKPSSSWAQAAGKGLNNGPISHDLSAFAANNGFQNDNSIKNIRSDFVGQSTELKEVALISDNWGNSVINQDSPWKLPPSPQSSPKESNASTWKSTSAGTEIWENSVRHKTKGPAPSSASTSSSQPWGHHTPATHIGGTWGEDEDPSNHWTGVPHSNNTNNWSANTNANTNSNNNGNNNMQWNSDNRHSTESRHNSESRHSSENRHNAENRHNSENRHIIDNNNRQIGDNRHNVTDNRNNADNRHNPETRQKANQSSTWSDYDQNDGTESTWAENKSESFGTWTPETTQKKDSHSSGWDADANDGRGGNYDDGTAVWGNPTRQGKVSHWKETQNSKPTQAAAHMAMSSNGNNSPQIVANSSGMLASNPSPGMIRLPAGVPISGKNIDNTWAQSKTQPNSTASQSQQIRNGPWTDMPAHRDSPNNGSVSVWCGGNGGGGGGVSGADSDIKSAANTPNSQNWSDSNSSPLAYWAAKPRATTSQASSWSDGQIDTSTWGGPKQGKPLSKDIIWASKQFRILTDMGFKKDDVENALRNCGMKLEDAIIELKAVSTRESNALDMELSRYKVGSGMSSNTPSLLSNTSGVANSSLTSINRNPPLVSMLQQTHQQNASQQSFTQANQVQSALGTNPSVVRIGNSAQSNPIPNASQLRVLVQQIQLAVQAGHLNAQILNQPLASPTLQLLYQLLQQIKILHQLQISVNQHLSKSGPTGAAVPALQSSINVQITQTKQRILNLQNQIAAQQAIFLKENGAGAGAGAGGAAQQQSSQTGQQQQIVSQSPNLVNNSVTNNNASLHSQQASNNSDFFKTPQNDNSMVTSDREFNNGSQAMSRFQTTWKAPNFNKEDKVMVNNNMSMPAIGKDFSRAPGPIPKQSAPNMLSRSDSTNWGGFRSDNDDSGWPSDVNVSSLSGGNNQKHVDIKDINAQNSLSSAIQPMQVQDAYNLTDLVPEFEPGKPWKGTTNMKSIEDDPTITPGSVTRSPLSINTIKDPMLFNWPSKLSPGTGNSAADSLASLSLSSSTWAFTPPSNSHIYTGNIENNNKTKIMKSPGWGSLNSELHINSCDNNLWSGGISKTRGPPPGLTPQIKSQTATSNSVNVNSAVSAAHNLWNADSRSSGQVSIDRLAAWSEFLLLRNLTPQIDGSTLKTLCLQHGPLQLFHLLLNHGIALARYSTREEAAKAQSALNNCVLGNTTILADIPSESEVQQYLQLISGQQVTPNSLNWSNNGQNNGSSNGVSQSSSAMFRNANNSIQYVNTSNSAQSMPPSKMESISTSTCSPSWNTSSISLWPFSNSGSNLWSAPSSLNAQDRSTPSSIQSLLPGDLLGGETN